MSRCWGCVILEMNKKIITPVAYRFVLASVLVVPALAAGAQTLAVDGVRNDALAPLRAIVATSHGAGKNTLLRSELLRLLHTHPRIRASLKGISAAKERTNEAFAEFLPIADLSGDTGQEVIDSPARRNTQGEPSSESRNKISLSVTQNLFNGFGSLENHRLAITRREIAERNRDATRQDVLLEGCIAYVSVLRQDQLVRLAAENENIIRKQLQLEDERVKRGSGIAVDVLLAKTRLQLAIERRVQLDGALRESVARYSQVFGQAPVVAQMRAPDLQLQSIPRSVGEAVKNALENNPSLAVTDREVEAAQHTTKASAAGFYPLVDLVGQANWEDDVDAVEGVRREWSVLLRFSWQIFSGLGTRARVASAAFEYAAAQDNHSFNRRKVIEELRLVWEQLNTARLRIDLLQNARIIAEEVFQARQRLRDAGRETAINVLDSQSEVFAAHINYVAASFDAQIAAFRVMSAMGLLTPEFLRI